MAGNLFHLQVVRGAEYQELADRRLSRTVSVRASRGEILDRYGRPLVTNRMAFSLSIDYLFWDQETQNDTILRLAALCQQNGAAYEDTLPISDAAPFSYSSEDSSEREQLSTYLEDELEQPADLTAEEAMAALIEEYEIDETLTPAEQRIIAGVRYQMVQTPILHVQQLHLRQAMFPSTWSPRWRSRAGTSPGWRCRWMRCGSIRPTAPPTSSAGPAPFTGRSMSNCGRRGTPSTPSSARTASNG